MPAVAYLPGLSYFSSLPGLIPTGFSIPRSLFSSILRFSFRFQKTKLVPVGDIISPNPQSTIKNGIIRFTFVFFE